MPDNTEINMAASSSKYTDPEKNIEISVEIGEQPKCITAIPISKTLISELLALAIAEFSKTNQLIIQAIKCINCNSILQNGLEKNFTICQNCVDYAIGPTPKYCQHCTKRINNIKEIVLVDSIHICSCEIPITNTLKRPSLTPTLPTIDEEII